MLGWWWWWGVIRFITLKVRCFYDCLPNGKSYTRQRAFVWKRGTSCPYWNILSYCIWHVFGQIWSVDLSQVFWRMTWNRFSMFSHFTMVLRSHDRFAMKRCCTVPIFSSLTQISWISFAHTLFLSSPTIVKLCIRHGSTTIVFYTKLQNDKQINWCYRPPRLRKI